MKKGIYKKDEKIRDITSKENVSFSLNNSIKQNCLVNQKASVSLFKWLVKSEAIIIIVIIFFMSIIYLIPNKIKLITKYKVQNFLVSNYKIHNQEKNYEIIELSIDSNKYLKMEEKDFIKRVFKKEFEENKNYIDTKLVTNRLTNLKTVYSNRNKFNENNFNISGSYNVFFNKINIFGDEENKFDNINKEIYFHEINHLFTKYTLGSSLDFANNSTKNILSETINELFTREYFEEYMIDNVQNEDMFGYEEYMYYVYALAELLEEDTLKKYKFYNNESILISGLLEIDNDFDKAYELINSINSANSNNIEIYKKLHDSYSYFYNKKYNKEIYEDLDILIYFYNTKVITDQEREIVRKELNLNKYDKYINFVPKGYISENFKSNHEKILIEK